MFLTSSQASALSNNKSGGIPQKVSVFSSLSFLVSCMHSARSIVQLHITIQRLTDHNIQSAEVTTPDGWLLTLYNL